ncbi:Clu domain-containing protein [Entamoeba marina]
MQPLTITTLVDPYSYDTDCDSGDILPDRRFESTPPSTSSSPLIIQHPRPAQPRLQSIKTLLKDSDNNNNDTFQPFDSSRNKNISTKIFDKRLGETAWKETITYNPGNKTSPTIQKDNLPLMSSALSWNERFQEILCKEECLEKFEELVSFYNDFLRTAEMYGKIIISEMFLPTEEKTIKPITTSNSNSERYIVRGIFFKITVNKVGIYQDDEDAAKAAGHQLKGLQGFYNARISGLHLPLAALIDFQGYRLFAISVLPIRSTTLCYGSRDGNTVIISNLEVSEKMEQAAKILNIKGHSIQNKLIYGPADVEVYEGLDGRYYLCDCARLFPCEAPPQDFKKRNYFDKSSYLYRLLRPEFIQMYYKPLSSDAFSPFDKYDPNKEVNRREIIEATKYLLEHVIPDFVQEIEQEQIYKKHDFRLTRDLHQAGINVRHLLNIWGITTKPLFAKIVITECVARAVKRKIKAMQRTQLRANPDVPLIGEFKEVLLNFFNILIAPMNNNQTKELWEQTIPKIIEKMFPIYIHSIEIPIGCNLRDSVDLNYFFTAISKLTGIYFSDEAVQEVVEDPHHFSFVDPDIVKIKPIVKELNMVNLAEGALYLFKSVGMKNGDDSRRLFQLSREKCEKAVNRAIDERRTLIVWASFLLRCAKQCIAPEDAIPYLALAREKVKEAKELTNLNDQQHEFYVLWGNISSIHATLLPAKEHPIRRASLYEEASVMYLKALRQRENALDSTIELAVVKQRIEMVSLVRTCLRNKELEEFVKQKMSLDNIIALEHSFAVTDEVVIFYCLVQNVRFITDRVLDYISTSDVCDSLHSLEICECSRLSFNAIKKVLTTRKYLHWLTITKYYQQITNLLEEQQLNANVISRHFDRIDCLPTLQKMVYFCTSSSSKFHEISNLLPWNILRSQVTCPPTNSTLLDRIKENVIYCYRHLRMPCFIEKGELVIDDVAITSSEFDIVGAEQFSKENAGQIANVYYTVGYTEDGINVQTYTNTFEVIVVSPPRATDRSEGWDTIIIPIHYYNTLSELANGKYILFNRYGHLLQMVFSNKQPLQKLFSY